MFSSKNLNQQMPKNGLFFGVIFAKFLEIRSLLADNCVVIHSYPDHYKTL